MTLFECKQLENDHVVDLEDLNEEDTKITVDIKRHRKFKIVSTLIDNRLDASQLDATFESFLVEKSAKLKEAFDQDPDSYRNYCNRMQDQFVMGKSQAEVRLDEFESVKVAINFVEDLLREYAEQASTLLGVCLKEHELSLEKDIVRVDYTCRLFSRIYGSLLEAGNEPSKEKFNCIDGYNTYNILEYVSFLFFFLLEIYKLACRFLLKLITGLALMMVRISNYEIKMI